LHFDNDNRKAERQLEMNKLTIAGLIFVILLAALCTWAVLVENSQPQFAGQPMFGLQIEPRALTKNNSIYNMSLTIDASAPETINKLQLNENITDLTTYVNGTTVNTANPLQIKLSSGDSIEVNFTMPCNEYSSVKEITVFSTDAMYYVGIPLSFPAPPLSVQPYLVTDLGWYLHNSTDPVSNMHNKFTIYGTITNRGATDAQNCSLTIKFYDNEELLQTSNIPIGEISGFDGVASLNSNVPCRAADSVTRTEVSLTGDNVS
jgi:hypothetical protein